jgi:hypothetical protein
MDSSAQPAFFPGQPVVWAHQPRGGYGYSWLVDGTVVRATGQRVVIRVLLKSGQTVERVVRPEHLKLRKQD